MKFGMNLLLWTDDPTQDSFFPVIQKMKKLGFDGVELPMFHLDIDRWEALGKNLMRSAWNALPSPFVPSTTIPSALIRRYVPRASS